LNTKSTVWPCEGQVSLFSDDPLTEAIRREVVETLERILAEELAERLGAGPYAREEGRSGYRNGKERRTLVTSLGPACFAKPRARLWIEGGEREFASRLLPRYQRRARRVDAAILSMYLGGVNTRGVKRILRALWPKGSLSSSAVSRVVARLRSHFETWQSRSLVEERLVCLYLDGIGIRTRSAGRVVSRPILVAVGVREGGEKCLLGLWVKGSESSDSWKGVIEDLVSRGLRAPLLCVIDGAPGLRSALGAIWPEAEVQRCAVHKLRNLLGAAPRHAHEEVREDFHSIVYAESGEEAERAYRSFVTKWRKKAASVAASLEEAGRELLTFFRYPRSMWKSLRTTNVIERLHEEFRRRVKTQGSLPTEEAVLVLLFGLVATGQVKLRRISGWKDLGETIKRWKVTHAA